ncbi:MAG: ABC transporter permease, partial [Anaerolinea sp.]|nr:ABC transporter permease [Anaerolinea sp.]
MKHTLEQVFHSSKFVTGFCIFAAILLIVIFYPLFVPNPPLEIIAQGSFFPPGTYVSTYDTVFSSKAYTLNLTDASAKRIAAKLGDKERSDIKDYLVLVGIPAEQIDTTNTTQLIDLWTTNYDSKKNIPGMIFSQQRYYQRLDKSLAGLLSDEGLILAAKNVDTGVLEQVGTINQADYVNIKEVASVRTLPLGTDNFGRDVLTELVRATSVSLMIGLIAGLIATFIGLALGLLAGYIG